MSKKLKEKLIMIIVNGVVFCWIPAILKAELENRHRVAPAQVERPQVQ